MEKVYLSKKPNTTVPKVFKNKDLSRLDRLKSETKEEIIQVDYNATEELEIIERDDTIILVDDYGNELVFDLLIVSDNKEFTLLSIEYLNIRLEQIDISKNLKDQIKKLAQNIVETKNQQIEDFDEDFDNFYYED